MFMKVMSYYQLYLVDSSMRKDDIFGLHFIYN